MDVLLQKVNQIKFAEIRIPGSKSETNRLLILQAIFPGLTIENHSASDDSILLRDALVSDSDSIDIHHAGTAMRFLTAYFAATPGKSVILTGSQRMQQRPIGVLVDALRTLGAEISYLEVTGFPPLKIKGRELEGGNVQIASNVSSQFITALLLISPKLRKGISLQLLGNITSEPYIDMTLALLEDIGINCGRIGNNISVDYTPAISKKSVNVESDWSAASYYYSVIALSEPGTRISLSHFFSHSVQGDSNVAQIFNQFGVETIFDADHITLRKVAGNVDALFMNLQNTPDLAQTIAVTCAGLGIKCRLDGLQTLKIKETDRIFALKTELAKFGLKMQTTQDSISFGSTQLHAPELPVETYDDHRMAMAFAALAVRFPIKIKNAEVVSKSYPGFFEDLAKIGFRILKD